MNLKLDWCSFEAAKYAVERWHYSQCMPAGKLVKIGVWENGEFIGCVLFGLGAGNSTNGTKYGLKHHGQMAELVRVALGSHKTPVTRILAISIRMLKTQSQDLRLLISFSDLEQGHHGGIYQGGGWIYDGLIESTHHKYFIIRGKKVHGKSLHSKYGSGAQRLEWVKRNLDPSATYAEDFGKHRYLMGLDDDMKKQIALSAKPYPKRDKQAMADTNQHSGGVAPTVTLHNESDA